MTGNVLPDPRTGFVSDERKEKVVYVEEKEEKEREKEKRVMNKKFSMEKAVYCMMFLVRLRKFLKRRIKIRQDWDYLLDTNLVVSTKKKLILLRGKEKYKGKIKNCNSCSVRYEIFRRGTFMTLRDNSHFVPFSFIMMRRIMAIRIVRFLKKFKVGKRLPIEYQRLLSSESVTVLELSEDEFQKDLVQFR
jgi:hypothetical protein